MSMRTSALLALAVLPGFLVGCANNSVSTNRSFSDADLRAVTNVVKSGDFPADLALLEVDNRSGPIRVVGTDAGLAGWTWKLTVRALDDATVQQAANAADCKVKREGNRLRLALSFPESDSPLRFVSELEIRAPKSVAVRTTNRYGRTEISELNGEVEATGKSGAVELHNIGGKVTAGTTYATLTVRDTGPATLRNQSGRIEATGIRGPLDASTSYAALIAHDIDGSVKLRNQSGRVEVARVAGDADVQTTYSELNAQDIRGDAHLVDQSGRLVARNVLGSVNARTSYAPMEIQGGGANFVCHNQSGAIQLRATSSQLTNLVARTSYAALDVRLPAALKPAIRARTSYADIESDWPVVLNSRQENPFAEVDPATPQITLENQSGRIRITRE